MKKCLSLCLTLCFAICCVIGQQQRNTVLEEFSTANCQYCPEGYQIIKKAVDSHPGTIWLVHHAGFFTDDITIPASERLLFLYGTNSFAPAYMIDRAVLSETYTDYSPVWAVSDSATIAAQLDERAAAPCFTTVNINDLAYDASTHTVSAEITGSITGDFDASLTRLTVYLVEDSIVMPQASTTGTIQDYLHMHAVRDCLTDFLGVPLTVAADGTFRHTIFHSIKSLAIASHCRLVALVHYYKATNLTLNSVLNATATGYLCAHTSSISTTDTEKASFDIFPNPASEQVVIESGSTILGVKVSNTQGRTMLKASPAGGNAFLIDVGSWSNGLYLVEILTSDGATTKKLIINR